MKIIFAALFASCLCALGAAPSFQQFNTNDFITVNGVSVRVSTNRFLLTSNGEAANLVVVGALTIGIGAASSTITSTNSVESDGMPFVLWNSWNDYNTNDIFMTNNPTAAKNQKYSLWAAGGVWTNAVNAHILSNTPTFSGAFGSLGAANPTQTNSTLVGGQWVGFATPTNLFSSTFYQTNACWRVQTCGPITNWLDYSNGIGGTVYSNGSAYDVVSRVGATNKSWLLRLSAP